MKRWVVYTDGSANNNQEIDKSKVYCGYAWALEPKKNEAGQWINSKGEVISSPEYFYSNSYTKEDGTNNKMELMAILDFLTKAQKKGHYIIRTDSSYAITSMQTREQRMASRVDDTLFLPTGQPAKNSDLLIAIYEQMTRLEEVGADIRFEKVKGHSGDRMNEFVDTQAVNRALIWKTSKIK